jgi:hypothetical protein
MEERVTRLPDDYRLEARATRRRGLRDAMSPAEQRQADRVAKAKATWRCFVCKKHFYWSSVKPARSGRSKFTWGDWHLCQGCKGKPRS